MNIPRVKTELSVSYVDHNLLYADNKNPDDHVYLQSIAKKYGLYLSRAGNGSTKCLSAVVQMHLTQT